VSTGGWVWRFLASSTGI